MTERRYTPPLLFKSADVSDDGEFTGYASTWGGPPDAHGDVVERGAFTKSLVARRPACLYAHDPTAVIGKWAELVEDSVGLKVRAALNLALAKGREVYSMLKHGDVGALSIGIAIPRDGWVMAAEGWGVIKEAALHEISVVACPANANARITSVKSFGSRDELADHLRQSGLAHRAVKKLLDRGWGAFAEDDDDPQQIEQLVEHVRRATERILKWTP